VLGGNLRFLSTWATRACAASEPIVLPLWLLTAQHQTGVDRNLMDSAALKLTLFDLLRQAEVHWHLACLRDG